MEQVRGFDRQFSGWAGGLRQRSAEVGGRAIVRPQTSSPPAKLAIKVSHLRKRRLFFFKPGNDLKFHPKWLQRYHNATCLVICMTLANIIQGMLMAGFVPASVSMLTKRFGFTNTQVAAIQSSFEVSSIVGLVVVSHYGHLGHKGRWLGIGLLIYSIGSLLFISPQIFSGPYQFAGSAPEKINFCFRQPGNFSCPLTPELGPMEYQPDYWIYLFVACQILRGLGSSPTFVLGPTYLDENVSQKRSPKLLGIMMGVSGIGPLLGSGLATVFLNIYGDVGKVDISKISLKPEDPRWYGAWWLGWLLAGSCGLMFCIPILGFARKLPKAAAERRRDISQEQDTGNASPEAAHSLKELPKAVFNLWKNKIFVCVIISHILLSALMGGVMLFGPRLLEDLFGTTSGNAILIFGFSGVVPAGAGMAVGGWLISRLKLKCRGIIRTCVLTTALSMPLLAMYMLHCDPLPVAGLVSVDYKGENLVSKQLTVQCNADCNCQSTGFQPVCDVKTGLSFYSPCHAGCTNDIKPIPDIPPTKWANCSCLANNDGRVVENGLCIQNCWKFPIFITLLVIKGFLLGILAPAMQQVQLRSVAVDQRTMALSLSWLIARLFGIIPGQIILGKIVDGACDHKGEPLGSPTAPGPGADACLSQPPGPMGPPGAGPPPGPPGAPQCIRYDQHKLATTITIYSIIIDALVVAVFLIASFCYKAREEPIVVEQRLVEIEKNGAKEALFDTDETEPERQ